jgi:Flp pilus assembly protein TadD
MKWKSVAALLALAIVTIVAYLPALPGEFQFDDANILRSTQIRGLGAFASAGAWSVLSRPLTAFTFAVDHAVHGFDTRGWHATSLALHLVAVVLAWRLARRMTSRAGVPRSEAAALGAAAVFALHPIQTEAVSYVSQRAEVLGALFTLGGILLLLAADEAPRAVPRAALTAGALGMHALGLASKPTAAVMPALWLAIATVVPAPEERDLPAWRRLAIRLPAALPLLALSAAAASWSLAGTRGSPDGGLDVPGAPWPLYVATELRAVPRYLSLLLWPAGQNVYWDVRFSTRLADPSVVAGAAFLAAVVALAVAGSRARRAGPAAAAQRTAALGAVSFLVALSPTLLVPLAEPFAEHRAYLATLWFALAIVGGGSALLDRVPSRRAPLVVAACAVGLVAALATATALRNEVWRTELALWRDAATKSPASGTTHTNLCRALLATGDPRGAIAACDRALQLGDLPQHEQVPLRYLALALTSLGRFDEARDRMLAFLERSPPEGDTLALLAKVELTAGRAAVAERYARDGIARDGAPRAYVVLGEVLEARGDLAGAASAFAQAARHGLGEALPLMALGRVQERRGMFPEACDAYARASDGPESSVTVRKARTRHARLGCPR